MLAAEWSLVHRTLALVRLLNMPTEHARKDGSFHIVGSLAYTCTYLNIPLTMVACSLPFLAGRLLRQGPAQMQHEWARHLHKKRASRRLSEQGCPETEQRKRLRNAM